MVLGKNFCLLVDKTWNIVISGWDSSWETLFMMLNFVLISSSKSKAHSDEFDDLMMISISSSTWCEQMKEGRASWHFFASAWK